MLWVIVSEEHDRTDRATLHYLKESPLDTSQGKLLPKHSSTTIKSAAVAVALPSRSRNGSHKAGRKQTQTLL